MGDQTPFLPNGSPNVHNGRMEFTDWHNFLGIGRHGSTLAASRALRISQSTVSRRVNALEAELGVKLCDRSRGSSRVQHRMPILG
jgi:Bacterial regulatory helix-turn-helix protein, lysR family